MREIKFRVWDKESKTMQKVGAIDWEYQCKDIITCNTQKEKLYFGYHEDLNPIIMQYTGLKDKRGEEIYEGDLLRTKNLEYSLIVEYMTTDCSFSAISTKTLADYTLTERSKYEVIGNIYENPELLGGTT